MPLLVPIRFWVQHYITRRGRYKDFTARGYVFSFNIGKHDHDPPALVDRGGRAIRKIELHQVEVRQTLDVPPAWQEHDYAFRPISPTAWDRKVWDQDDSAALNLRRFFNR